ncbi:uncharacterized protein DUF1540 [Ureibacillus xyleni]|uniref:Uncharacterized protein DUF1540 n=1 Tax=Ureibacillus xyleni TaxID=614648 RepID=A0A285RYF0_9BACL|nr:DUF1540 domain-containing protein [Ureibacillus xyleni]SOB99588.1 uncharacterized protein DUF1540 [Ureibacillus xyleni]
MASDVLCEVNSCTYWASGNKCDATKIYVVASRNEASNSEETDCKTFKKKEEDSFN